MRACGNGCSFLPVRWLLSSSDLLGPSSGRWRTAMTDSDDPAEDEQFQEALENSQPIMELGESLADAAIAEAAAEAGRTPEQQRERMGDRFEYEAVEQNPCQRQLDDYRGTVNDV